MHLQHTLKNTCEFSGKGLHTGKFSSIRLCPAPVNTGVVFKRVDLEGQPQICALAEYVTNTSRSTTISDGTCTVVTIEHLMAALTGMGVDNCIVEVDNIEIPILDGSAKLYCEAISKVGLQEQDAPRVYIELEKEITITNENGASVTISPAADTQYDIEIDFNSKVVGLQHAAWNPEADFAQEIGSCRTFVFFHELEFLLANNLIKGGDVDNALVIVEHEVSPEQLSRVTTLFNKADIQVDKSGYLSNVKLNFPNECARHKMLDLIGDLRLCGGFLHAKVKAVRSGHSINTNAAKAVREAIN